MNAFYLNRVTSYAQNFRSSLGTSPIQGFGYLNNSRLYGQYMQKMRRKYPIHGKLKRCESEAENILFFAKGNKIPESLENRPYADIPEGRLIKMT